jgi:hypothetical protein
VLDEAPAIEIEIVFRLQRLVGQPDPAVVLDVLPQQSPPIGPEAFERGAPTVEIAYATEAGEPPAFAIEVGYEGLYELAEETLADGSSTALDEHFGALGGWISSMLVRLGDLKLDYLPPEEEG